MSVSIKHLIFISPFKILLDTGDIVQAKCVKTLPNCTIVTDRNENWHNKTGIYNEYNYLINGEIVTKKQIKEFLIDKEKIQELTPYESLGK
ncbi:hypothetical protein RBU49_02950 [Clostridium sp. MB40-C1]|uniref:hypothetical protein n=1 Tax=Clostridium sp. MB40-C1 TaxID=3070996 RepID=UPI0027E00EAD|nr:hypothetical protein [Clostridium sp. MB40-C1]WMJ81228.1 hypothetical protein RBU49_02950 [Clostridium sp. MB40-C1]